ncbi:MAG: nuclear transport factor 2 family protein, partial [Acidimicrobiia bacterium]|nr:nuclear transport factor 2 family protein [Acidimicrobiia bacterium]
DAIVQFLRDSMGSQQFLSAHRVGQPEIDVTGPDTATGTWALMDLVLQLEFGVDIRGAAFYEDEYVKVDGEWKIKSTGYKRTYEELEPRAKDITLTAHIYDTGGRSSLNG